MLQALTQFQYGGRVNVSGVDECGIYVYKFIHIKIKMLRHECNNDTCHFDKVACLTA